MSLRNQSNVPGEKLQEKVNKTNNKPGKAPEASFLLIDTVADFCDFLRERECGEVFVTATTTPPAKHFGAAPGTIYALLSAWSSEQTAPVYYVEAVRLAKSGVVLTELDQIAQGEMVEEAVEARLHELETALQGAGLTTRRGQWVTQQ